MAERSHAEDRLNLLKSAVDKALIQISGGLCYHTASAKHGQLMSAQMTLQGALDRLAAMKDIKP